ncbi:MAG: gluconokinase [Chthoniobacteraceae bacterium]
MPSHLVLALDLGTSSTRTAIFDAHANRILPTTTQQTYKLITSPDGGAELDPTALMSAVRHCLDQTMRVYRSDPAMRTRAIAGIGVSSFWHSLLGVNAKGDPVTRVITWADSRCRADAAALREKFGEKALHARTGCMVRASFWPAKLKWLRRTQPKVWARVKQWMSPAEWLQLKLTGGAHCALGMATGTGLFNPSTMQWDAELLKTCAISPALLRPLSDAPLPVAGLLAREFPELRGVPWFPGIGDGAASNLGSGATRPGIAAINFGTSGALRVIRETGTPRAPFGVSCYRVDARRYLVGGAISNAGNLRAWGLRELKLPDDAALEAELAQRPGPAPGLSVLPFWNAERAPKWNEEQRGAIVGITHHTTALDLLQAITEASYQRLARIAELIFATEKTTPKLIVSGGILRSAQALQRLADVFGQPLYPSEEMEASIRGAAIYALEQLGDTPTATRFGPPVKPRAQYAKLYAEARERQRKIEALL